MLRRYTSEAFKKQSHYTACTLYLTVSPKRRFCSLHETDMSGAEQGMVSYKAGDIRLYKATDFQELLRLCAKLATHIFQEEKRLVTKGDLKGLVEQWQDDYMAVWGDIE